MGAPLAVPNFSHILQQRINEARLSLFHGALLIPTFRRNGAGIQLRSFLLIGGNEGLVCSSIKECHCS